MKKVTLSLGILWMAIPLFAQTGIWQKLPSTYTSEQAERRLAPEACLFYKLNLETLKSILAEAPEEGVSQGKVVALPMPDGSFKDFALFDSPVMQPGLAAKYPDVKTFSGYWVKDPKVKGRFDVTQAGFHGYILGMGSPVIIDPVYRHEVSLYQVFFQKDLPPEAIPEFACEVESGDAAPVGTTIPAHADEPQVLDLASPRTEAVQLRTYRLALATTGEYSQKYGGNKPSILAEVVTAINRVNSITERDFAVHFNLIDNTDTLFFLNAQTDPYTNGNTQAMINENPTAIGQLIPLNQYDIGHVFGTNGGGLAQLQSICTGSRARGVTSAGGNNGDQFYVDYVAHEMGHQMGANHTFNNCSGFAGGNENPGTAYEPGSGATIMSYSGICGANNLQFDSEPYYHVASVMEITNYLIKGFGNSCAQKTDVGNHYPTSNAPYEDGFYIPIRTAFLLNGEATDEDGDSLTYSWEEFDLGPLSPLGNPSENAPIFRVWPPTNKTYRFFPRLQTIFSGSTDIQELLPTYSRDLTFQFVVRDNHPGGGATAWDKVAFHATADAGPFIVTSPNFDDNTWTVGQIAPVVWDVANTDQPPVNCHKVNIRLIKGSDYENSLLLAQNIDNSGSAYVQVPDAPANNYHIIVEAADNVFLDASSGFLKIESPTTPQMSAGISRTALQMCLPTTEQIDVFTAGTGGFSDTIFLSVTGSLPQGADVHFVNDAVLPGQTTQLVLDFEQVTDLTPVNLTVIAQSSTGTPIEMPLTLTPVNFDFSALSTISPANGATGVAIFPLLEWTAQANADAYQIQVATSPVFEEDSVVIDKSGLTNNSLQLNTELNVNTVYYWRVRASNACGPGDWTLPAVFATKTVNCTSYDAGDVPLVISANNTDTKTSVINIPGAATVNDLNVNHLQGNHSFLGELSIRLTAPNGASAYLIKNQCSNLNGTFDLSFDDEANVQNPCILNGKTKPFEPLSVFAGVPTQGDWTLTISDDTPGSGGKINAWSLELCADAVANSPQLVHNDTLIIDNGAEKHITSALLSVEDADNAPGELVYTLVQLPKYGQVKFYGIPLETGGHFTQEDINNNKVNYYNFPGEHPEDVFYFTVKDPGSGFVPVTPFHIQIGPVATGEERFSEFEMFPNPTADEVTVLFGDRLKGRKQLELLDFAGRTVRLLGRTYDNQLKFSVSDLPQGIYWVRMTSATAASVQKLVVGK